MFLAGVAAPALIDTYVGPVIAIATLARGRLRGRYLKAFIMAQLIPYDDRDGYIWLNGELVAWRDAKVHVLTHAPALWQLRVRGRALL